MSAWTVRHAPPAPPAPAAAPTRRRGPALGLVLGLLSFASGCANKGTGGAPPPAFPGDATAEAQQLGTAAGAASRSGPRRGAARHAPSPAEQAPAMADARVDRAQREHHAPAVPSPSLGTSYGERLTSHVTETVFVRRDEHRPSARLELGYDDPAGAFAPYPAWSPDLPTTIASAGQRGLSVTLVDERGQPLPATRSPHRGLLTAVGAVNQRYELVIHNDTAERYEVVISVDGIDVIDGTDASYEHDGYVIDPHDSLSVAGWRTDYHGVAAFRFADVPDSYGGQTGRPHNVGVIGVAFFDERSAPRRQAWTPAPNEGRPYSPSPDPFPAN